jgi:hypothetical protein
MEEGIHVILSVQHANSGGQVLVGGKWAKDVVGFMLRHWVFWAAFPLLQSTLLGFDVCNFFLPSEAVTPIRVKLFFCDIWKASIYLPSGVTPGSGRRGVINLTISCWCKFGAHRLCPPPPLKLTKCILFKLWSPISGLFDLATPFWTPLLACISNLGKSYYARDRNSR